MLVDRGILYAPDYVINSGGVIQVADEIQGFNFDRAKGRAEKIFGTTRQILELAAAEGVPPSVAADRHGRAPDGRGRPATDDPPALGVDLRMEGHLPCGFWP